MQQNPNPKILRSISCEGKNYILIEGGWQIEIPCEQDPKELIGKRLNVAKFKKIGNLASCIV